MYTTLISAPQLQALLKSGQPCMVFDCSFELMQPGAGEQQYQQAHIPGAVRADLDRRLSAAKTAPDAASGGRHPLPSRATFAAWLGSIGFSNNMQAVVYDRQGANYCGRLWWMLKWAGMKRWPCSMVACRRGRPMVAQRRVARQGRRAGCSIKVCPGPRKDSAHRY